MLRHTHREQDTSSPTAYLFLLPLKSGVGESKGSFSESVSDNCYPTGGVASVMKLRLAGWDPSPPCVVLRHCCYREQENLRAVSLGCGWRHCITATTNAGLQFSRHRGWSHNCYCHHQHYTSFPGTWEPTHLSRPLLPLLISGEATRRPENQHTGNHKYRCNWWIKIGAQT